MKYTLLDMKKTFTFILISAMLAGVATTASALGFSTIMSDDKAKNTFTKCGWESDPHINKVPLKGKPSRGDHVWIRTDGKAFVIDASPTIASLSFLYNGTSVAEAKTIQLVKGSFHMELPPSPKSTGTFTLKKSKMLIRSGVTCSVWEKNRGIGESKFVLEDSTIEAGGAFAFNMPAWNAKFTKNRSGVVINMAGASFFKCKGDILIDSAVAENQDLHFRFILNEKDGKMPFMSVRGGSLNGTELHLNVKGKLRAGIYPLIEATGAKDFTGKFKAMTLNGKNISLNSGTSVNGMTLTVKVGSADKRKANDYVLEVK